MAMTLLRLMVILLVGISTLLMVVHSLLLVPRNPLQQPPAPGPRRSLEATGRSASRAEPRASTPSSSVVACRGSQYRTPHEIAQAAPPLQEAEVTALLKQRLQLAADQNPTLSSVEAKQSQQLQASSVDGASSADRAVEAFFLALAQSFLVIDAAKVLFTVFTAPQLVTRVLPPDKSTLNRLLVKAIRNLHRLLEALL